MKLSEQTVVIRNGQLVDGTGAAATPEACVIVERGHIRYAGSAVAAPEMARVNQTFLGHEGSTDVITFDHSDPVAADVRRLSHPNAPSTKRSEPPHVGCYEFLNGELFISLDDAVKQAREFRTTWQSELVRYVIHGLLHLCGHDDLKPAARRKMKRKENRLLRETAKRFPLAKLGTRNPKRGAANSAFRTPRSAI